MNPRLQIRFNCSEEELQLYRPDGQPFASYLDISQQLNTALQEVEQTQQRLQAVEQRAERLAEKLRSLGINPK